MKVTTDEINVELQLIPSMRKSFEKINEGLKYLSNNSVAKNLCDVDYVKQMDL